ncbi:MAG: hypothetical protein H0X26_07265 [Alphaproteobacteria bacterium]|nr:hypothetical protein [Alphaproteobacteria bacterium]
MPKRSRSQSLSDFRQSFRNNTPVINFDTSLSATPLLEDKIALFDKPIVDKSIGKPEDFSNPLTNSSSSTNSSPRSQATNASTKSSTENSPTQSSKSLELKDKNVSDIQPPILILEEILPQNVASSEIKEDGSDIISKEASDTLHEYFVTENSTSTLKSPNLEPSADNEQGLIKDNKNQINELEPKPEDKKIESSAPDLIIEPLKKSEEIITPSAFSIQEEQLSTADHIIPENGQVIVSTEKVHILSENKGSESPSESPSNSSSLMGSSPREAHESTSRRNSDSSDEGVVTGGTEVQTNSFANESLLKIMESKGNEQNGDSSSSPSSRDKSSDTLNTTESSSPENSDSSKISFESLEGKQTSSSPDIAMEKKESVLSNPVQKEKLNFLNLNKQKREFPAQKKNGQKGARQDAIITNFDNHSDIGEKTSLLSNIRKPVKRASGKKEDLTKDWEKLGTSEDELTFKRESGNLTDDPNSILFEGDIGVLKKNVLALKNSQALDEKSKKHKLQRVVLEGSGSDEWSFELISDQKGRSDYKGKELRSYPINGDESILLENEEKSWPKLIPDGLKGFIENEDLLSSIQVSLENEGSEEESSDQGSMVLNRPRQHKLDQLLNELPPGAKVDLKEIVNLWEKGAAMLVGAGIGAYNAYGTGILYNASIFTLVTKFDYKLATLLSGAYLFNYTVISTSFDSIFRNALYGKKVLSYYSRRGVNIKDAVVFGTISILPSLLTPFALISAEFEFINFFPYPQDYVQSVKEMITSSPVLFLNDWAFNINMTAEIKKNVKKWAEASDSYFARCLSGWVFCTSLPSEEEMRKQRLNKKFDILIKELPSQSDKKVREIYDTIKSANTTIAAELAELENLEAGVKFLTYRYVLSLGHEMEQAKSFSQGYPNENIENEEFKREPKPKVLVELDNEIQPLSSAPFLSEDEKQRNDSQEKYWYEIYDKVTDALIGTSLVMGSPARLITMVYVVQESLKALMYNSAEVVLSGSAKISSGIFASLTGFPIQTGFEYKGMKNFAKMVWSMEDHGHESYPWTRKGIKLACVAQGFVLAVPALILGLQACTDLFGEDWLKDPDFTPYKWMTLTSIFNYFFAEWAVQTTVAEEFWNRTFLAGAIDGGNQHVIPAYNQYVLPTLNERIQPLISDYMAPLRSMKPLRTYHQDWLIRFFKEQKEEINYLHPQIHFELERLL